MKKTLCIVLAIVIVFAVAGCGGSSAPAATEAPAAQTPTKAPTAAPTPAPTPVPTETPKAEWEILDTGVTTEKNSIGTLWYAAWYLIENTGNLPLYLETVDMDIETASGQMVKKITMMDVYPQVLLPGEVGVYHDVNMLDDGTETEGLKLHGKPKPVEAKVECIRYTAEDVEYTADKYYGTKLMGRVVNDTDEDTKMLKVAALCYDADGAYLGAMYTYISDGVPANDYAGFEMHSSGMEIDAGQIADVVVYAYPNQYQF